MNSMTFYPTAGISFNRQCRCIKKFSGVVFFRQHAVSRKPPHFLSISPRRGSFICLLADAIGKDSNGEKIYEITDQENPSLELSEIMDNSVHHASFQYKDEKDLDSPATSFSSILEADEDICQGKPAIVDGKDGENDMELIISSFKGEDFQMLNFDLLLKYSTGKAHPLGVSAVDGGINFSLFSQHASSVILCLFISDRDNVEKLHNGMMEVVLDPKKNKTGDVWHVCVEGLPESGVLYGYRVDGPQGWDQGHRYDVGTVLLDPYAKLVSGRRIFGDVTHRMSKFFGTYDFCSVPFDWGTNYKLPNIPETDVVIYEMNVRSFTADESSGLDQEIRGSYLGVINKIPHLLELGVNAVELLPVFEFDELEFQRYPNPRDHMVYFKTLLFLLEHFGVGLAVPYPSSRGV
ncbi:hypothetical protein HPP92_005664 [Vanilla planifolia]|uniref:Glycoside hydrolase family 13 N-terminal domain-containing protein n=1 Tax=Vanilla planifolia TaxID=51239 RepID=A0A835RUH3_VANPL|nr:hypothetical protein HPP92_005664 [Vanilla planifolia]